MRMHSVSHTSPCLFETLVRTLALSCTLSRTQPPLPHAQPKPQNPRGLRKTYTVTTRTGVSGTAATDANVYVELRGSVGNSSRHWLRNSSASTFQNGQVGVLREEARAAEGGLSLGG